MWWNLNLFPAIFTQPPCGTKCHPVNNEARRHVRPNYHPPSFLCKPIIISLTASSTWTKNRLHVLGVHMEVPGTKYVLEGLTNT